MAYTRVNWENYPSTNTPRNATNLNVMDAGIEDLDTRLTTAEGEIDAAQLEIDNLQTGWNSAGETWAYSSVDDPTGVITISGDKTTKYSLGMRIKFTNGGNVIYGIITAISYSSPNTTLTFLHEIDPTDSLALYLMDNSAITNNYYSNMKAPFGFPVCITHWTIKTTNNSINSQASPTANAWYNIGSIILTLPIGSWKLSYKGKFECDKTSDTTGVNVFVTISTANNSNSNPEFGATASGLKSIQFTVSVEDSLSVTVKTPIYLNIMTTVSECDYIYSIGATGALLVLKAVCAYL